MLKIELESWECISDQEKEWLPIIEQRLYPVMPQQPEIGKFYRIYPEGCISGNNKAYHGVVRLGTNPKKLMVFLNGGGCCFDEYTAARPGGLFSSGLKESFYFNETELIGDCALENGVGSEREDNPFREWTIINILYSTGDFHAGTGDFGYTALDNSSRILPHHGLTNAMAVIDMAKQWVSEPEQLLICGSSAGGFGVALIADDIIQKFPNCQNITCIVDSSLLLKKEWPQVARDVWKSPEHICEHLHTDNITLDGYTGLYKKYGDKIKYLFCCSIRDAALIQFQNFIYGKGMIVDEEGCDQFGYDLKVMCDNLLKQIPEIGIFIFDELLDFPGYEQVETTRHCILAEASVFDYPVDGKKAIQWIMDAIEGKVDRIGLNLIKIG